jgi:hypothetical protein
MSERQQVGRWAQGSAPYFLRWETRTPRFSHNSFRERGGGVEDQAKPVLSIASQVLKNGSIAG